MMKVDLTPVSGTARAERIFNEALAGVVEFDLYDVPAAMQNRFVKGGVVAGPFEWRKPLWTMCGEAVVGVAKARAGQRDYAD